MVLGQGWTGGQRLDHGEGVAVDEARDESGSDQGSSSRDCGAIHSFYM